ncbi:MAG: hypothetical protein HY548_06585 [Elusimicrobia bacterium]|nr:hypothetical protein [Elusimicrobiota bacterium]
MQIRLVFFFGLLIPFLAFPLFAAFQGGQAGVRSISLGRAGTAASGGAQDIMQHPSAAGELSQREIYLAYGKPFAGLDGINIDTAHMAAVLPLRWGTLGLGFSHLRMSGLEERVLAVNYGRAFFDVIQSGLTIKELSHRYIPSAQPGASRDPVFSKNDSRRAWTFDAGASAELPGPFRAGVTVRNVKQVDVGLVTPDIVRREIQGGFALDLSSWGLEAAGDLVYRRRDFGDKNRLAPRLGLEKTFQKTLKFRLGLNPDELTTGFGLQTSRFSFDYGVAFNRHITDGAGSHRAGMGYSFGRRKSP